MRSRGLVAALAAGLLGTLAGGCSSGPLSYVVLYLQSSTTTPILGVTDVDVQVLKGTNLMKALTYHHDAVNIGMDMLTSLSISFTSDQVGAVSFVVGVRASGCLIASGFGSATIQRGGRTDATVALSPLSGCPSRDGGADGGDIFAGCDPVTPTCGPNMTCQIDCTLRLGECTAGGTGGPGTTCTRNSDCIPGSQCFDYTSTGCPVKVCLRFCNTIAECAQPGADAGVNPGSLCEGPVECSGFTTGYRTCTFGCDPRLAAVSAGSTGCPTGLSCLIVGDSDQVDCACPEATRIKHEGDDCARASDCAPGLVCDLMTGGGKCRPVCHCATQGGGCTVDDNDCPTANTRCVPLAGDALYGVCL